MDACQEVFGISSDMMRKVARVIKRQNCSIRVLNDPNDADYQRYVAIVDEEYPLSPHSLKREYVVSPYTVVEHHWSIWSKWIHVWLNPDLAIIYFVRRSGKWVVEGWPPIMEGETHSVFRKDTHIYIHLADTWCLFVARINDGEPMWLPRSMRILPWYIPRPSWQFKYVINNPIEDMMHFNEKYQRNNTIIIEIPETGDCSIVGYQRFIWPAQLNYAQPIHLFEKLVDMGVPGKTVEIHDIPPALNDMMDRDKLGDSG